MLSVKIIRMRLRMKSDCNDTFGDVTRINQRSNCEQLGNGGSCWERHRLQNFKTRINENKYLNWPRLSQVLFWTWIKTISIGSWRYPLRFVSSSSCFKAQPIKAFPIRHNLLRLPLRLPHNVSNLHSHSHQIFQVSTLQWQKRITPTSRAPSQVCILTKTR